MSATVDIERSSRRAPAPWDLRAEGYVFVLRSEAESATESELGEPRIGPIQLAMFMDYSASPVGPYRELLFIPGVFSCAGRELPSITKIYVDTRASIENGRRNWGIPKELASFTVEHRSERRDHLSVRVEGQPAVELAVEGVGPRLPAASWMLPARLRTLCQRLEGETFEVTPRGRARVQRAKVLSAWSDPAYFPKLSPERIVFAARISQVALTFPEAVLR